MYLQKKKKKNYQASRKEKKSFLKNFPQLKNFTVSVELPGKDTSDFFSGADIGIST